ncbi:MAG: class I SAM-dependent methyltransferase [Bacteroidia bacterium]|nr:class I SAM-dependent methyltransferase [Bacteroidia bacterium]
MKDTIFRVIKYLEHFIHSHKRGHGIHSEFLYRFLEGAVYQKADFYHLNKMLKVRDELRANTEILNVEDFGAGSKTLGKMSQRKVKEVYAASCSPHWKSGLYFKMLNYLKCKNILELGTNLGINALALSGLGDDVRVDTVDAAGAYCEFARNLLNKYGAGNVRVFHETFDDFLEKQPLEEYDAVIIDGNHKKEPFLKYSSLLLNKCRNLKILIADDIYWSRGMYKGWTELINQINGPNLFLDAFHFGLILKNDSILHKSTIKIFVG